MPSVKQISSESENISSVTYVNNIYILDFATAPPASTTASNGMAVSSNFDLFNI